MDRCWAFTLAFNEEVMIRYWARHYRTFCERLIVYVDTDTDDGTILIAEEEGAETRPYVSGGRLDDMAFIRFAEEQYKEARGKAEWFVWVDADEILYHPHLAGRLDTLRSQGVNAPPVTGYTMVADAPPTGDGQIYDELRMGFPAEAYSKPCLFDPELDIIWEPGKHTAHLSGGLVRATAAPDELNGTATTDPLKLLHYRYLGEQWMLERNARNFARVPLSQRGALLGIETFPGYSGPYSPAWYAEQRPTAQEVIAR
jgi:hypothetical protein